MITEDEKWHNADKNGDAEGNYFEGFNRESRPQRVYTNERSYRPRFNPNADSSNRPQRGYNNGGERPYRPRFTSNESGEQRPYRPRFNSNEGGEQRSYRSRFNNNEGGEQRPYRPRFNSSEGGEQRSYRPRFNQGNGGYNSERPYRPRFNNEDDSNNGEQYSSYRPHYNSEGGEQRSFRPRQNNGGRFGKPQGRFLQRKGNNIKPNNHRPVEYSDIYAPDDDIRLNKFLANAGICSRREADEYIQAGVVSVNGEVVKELGTKIKRGDEVKFHEQPVSIERKIYVLLNKPKDCVTTTDDPQARKTVMDIVRNACPERIYPVGRLDRNTTGVLLLTNDGELASKLTHPKYEKKKIYRVKLDKDLTQDDMNKIVTGIELEDGEIHADEIAYADDTKKNDIGIEIHSGKNRIVRRIFEHLGYKVTKLDRVFFAGLTKKGLKRGDWRFLTQQEVNFLRMGSFS